ncbi:MAG: DNA-binding protein [Planctomycetales bacterium]
MNSTICECEHDFALVLTGVSELTQAMEDALFTAGCDDATISVRSGRIWITFSCKSDSLKEAILSAIDSVRNAKIGAEVLRVDHCNLVTQSDIARKIERSRQLVHQFISGTRGPGGFPPPACHITDGAPLWYWCEVANWLWQNDMIKERVLRDAQEVDAINCVLEMQHQQRIGSALIDEVASRVAV